MKLVWKFVHNAIAHPLMAFWYEPEWVSRFHNFTAKKWGDYNDGK